MTMTDVPGAVDDGPVLVTGASGFLGSWLIAGLIERGKQVVAFDVSHESSLLAGLVGGRRADALEWLSGDIRDRNVVDGVFDHVRPTAVVHLAALTIPACRENPLLGIEVNVGGHINVLSAAHRQGIRRIVYASSAAAHPRGTMNAPANIYGVSKHAAEDISKVFFLERGIATIGLRPNVVYGFGRTTGETAAISEAIRAAAEGAPYTLPFSSKMCFEYIEEVVEVFIRCLAATPDRPIVSDITTRAQTTDDLIAAIGQVEPRAQIEASDRFRASPDVPLDSSDLTQLIGQWPRISLVDGVRKTITRHRDSAAVHS